MINKDLTIESGLAALGEVEEIFAQDYKENDPLAVELSAFDNIVRGALKTGRVKKFKGIEYSPEVLSAERAIIEKIRKNTNTLLQFCEDSSEMFWCRLTGQVQGSTTLPISDLMDVLREARMNAIGHGTAYCTKGEVQVRGAISSKGALFCIIQNTPGPNDEQLEKLYKAKQEDRLQYQVEHMTRGNGFTKFVQANKVNVNFQTTKEGGCILIAQLEIPINLLEPLDLSIEEDLDGHIDD